MPKIIENLREILLAASRTLLLEEGYRALTMRQVAGLCHVAVGTVYNYFPSKDMLAAHILLEDWNDLLRSLQKKVNDLVLIDFREFPVIVNCLLCCSLLKGVILEVRCFFKTHVYRLAGLVEGYYIYRAVGIYHKLHIQI